MALVRFSNGKDKEINAEQGSAIWRVLYGLDEGTPEQQDFCLNVKKLYLNWRNPLTPDEYITENWEYILPMHLLDWMVKPVAGGYEVSRPDPSQPNTAAFAKKWGLYAHGQITDKVPRYMRKA